MTKKTTKKKRNYVSFPDVETRVTDFVKSEDIYINGEDNLYPDTVQKIAYQSPTTTLAVRALTDFIAGRGVENDEVINSLGQYKSEIVREIALDVSIHYGFWIHVSYRLNDNLQFEPYNPVKLNYLQCRKSKEDDVGNSGKIYIDDWAEKSGQSWFDTVWNRVTKNSKKEFYPFNPKQSVVRSQIEVDGGIEKYRGQVMYVNLTPQFPYALSLFHAVLNDADSESRMGIYTNMQLRGGFQGKTLIATSGLDDEAIDAIEEWIGVEGASGIANINLEYAEDISKAVNVQQIKSQYDEKQFSETKEDIKERILGSAKNLPKQLVLDSNGLFAQSGESIQQLKEFFNEQTVHERNTIELALERAGAITKIMPLIDEKTKEDVTID